MSHAKDAETERPSPLHLVVALLDTALRLMEAGRLAMGLQDEPGQNLCLQRASRILSEIQASLDTDRRRTMAKSLHSVYGHVIAELAVADAQQDARRVDGCILALRQVRENWQRLLDAVEESRPKRQVRLAA